MPYFPLLFAFILFSLVNIQELSCISVTFFVFLFFFFLYSQEVADLIIPSF